MKLFNHFKPVVKKSAKAQKPLPRPVSLDFPDEIAAAKSYIDENYACDISVKDIADYICFSESWLTRNFSLKYGTSPKQYLLQKRILKATELLTGTHMTSAAISRATGFSSPGRFNDIFRKFTGTTPLEFRKAQKN